MAMKLSDTLAEAFNKQVTAELEASLVYLQLSYILDDLGLVGMRERVASHGGALETGPRADGGFRVRAVLPIRNGEP